MASNINWMDAIKLGAAGASGYGSSAAASRAADEEARLAREELRQSGEKNYNDAIAQREKDRQDSALSAYKRLNQYDFINQGGTHTPMVSPYSRAVQGPGANAQRLSTDEGIVNELHQRASFGDPYAPGTPGLSDSNLNRLRVPGSDNPGDVYGNLNLAQAGKGEKAAGWLSTLGPLVTALEPWKWFKKGKPPEQQPKPGSSVSAGGANDPVGTTPPTNPWPWEGQCEPGEVWMGPSGGCVKG